jgi:8-oxo-dGTP pyrophosphatase MutT (NUDIX family)
MTHAILPFWNDATADEKLNKLRLMVADLYRYQLGAQVEHIVAILEAHAYADEKEAHDVQHIIELCRAHPNILSPLCDAGHITGSALVVDPRATRVLLNHHRKFNRWMQFGGHMEHETEPHVTALREAREETGLRDLHFLPDVDEPKPFDVDVHLVPQQGNRPPHEHLDLRYLLATDQPEQASATHESNEVRWFTFAELESLDLEPGVRRMIRKAQAILDQRKE